MKILVIDNYDSFTYNLVHTLKKFENVTVEVRRNDELEAGDPDSFDKIVFSPGPGLPEEAGSLLTVIRNYAGKKPMLGVCLGHQAIGEIFGGKLVNMNDVIHGIATPITVVANSYLFDNIPETFVAGRYHSWIVDKDSLPAVLQITSIDGEGRVMSFQHKEFDIQGVQFHPESILTPLGEKILKNWALH
jgi:anthranilate synthase component II